MVIAGVDPGNKGALAFCSFKSATKFEVLGIHDMPLAENSLGDHVYRCDTICSILSQHSPEIIVVEKVNAFGHEGSQSLWAFAQGYGTLLGIFETYAWVVNKHDKAKSIKTIQVPPKSWQHTVLPKGDGRKIPAKQRTKEWVLETFPSLNLYGPRGGFLDGRADALAIMTYGAIRKLKAEVNAS